MANIYPSQIRTVDPFESYNSNVVNRLTRMVTHGENCLFSITDIDVTTDSTSSDRLDIMSGQAFKDDVIVEFDTDTTIDLNSQDYYLTTNGVVGSGYHYICMEYTYFKSKPAPNARIRILRPDFSGSDERDLYSQDSKYLFLKCVDITFNAGLITINDLYNYDPENPLNQRETLKTYINSYVTLPTFYQPDHESMLIYITSDQTLWYGNYTEWIEITTYKNPITTTGCSVGDVGYLTSSGTILPAIATSESTLACGVVWNVGEKEDTGQIIIHGIVEDVGVETGIVITNQDLCYLSSANAGKITNVAPDNYAQFLGIAITDSTSSLIDILFDPTSVKGYYNTSKVKSDIIDLVHSNIEDSTSTLSLEIIDLIGENFDNIEETKTIINNEIINSSTDIHSSIIDIIDSRSQKFPIEIKVNEMEIDNTDHECEYGSAFGMVKTMDFPKSDDGAVWFSCDIPNGFDQDSTSHINFDIIFNDSGIGPVYNIILNTKIWVVGDNEYPNILNPDHNTDNSVPTSSSGTKRRETLTVSIDKFQDNDTIIFKLKRSSTNVLDTYNGTFQLISVIVYQD